MVMKPSWNLPARRKKLQRVTSLECRHEFSASTNLTSMGSFLDIFFGNRARRDQSRASVSFKNWVSPVNHYGTCFGCNGSGHKTLDCRPCSGRGQRTLTCKPCEGSGKFTGVCRVCSGRGIFERQAQQCFTCRGTGRVGRNPCLRCQGRGNVKPATSEQCRACGGSGRFSAGCKRCGGSGSFTVSCNRCNGSGSFTLSCRKCGGSGWHKF